MLLAILVLVVVLALLVVGQGYWAWVLGVGTALWSWATPAAGQSVGSPVLLGFSIALWAAAAVVFGYRPWRRKLLSGRIMAVLGPILPKMSETERVALEAGTVWWDGELFSGDPDWRRLLDFQVPELTPRERAFLDGPVEQLCHMVDDWRATQRGDLAAETWEFMKRERFLGLIIPQSYGGLGFSAQAHSAVITKLSTRSCTAAVSVMVPNSLGPAELLLHYGTDEQRNHWLPRLAKGEEIPCFALTGPENGSDAAAMEAHGVVCRGEWEGSEVVGIRLSWDKRYTTLGPVATVIGLAFKLYDPEHLIGEEDDLGITCALIPAQLPGIRIGERHDPLGVPFLNGPNWGRDVFVPLDAIIGGPEMAGQGWRMLMDCLAAGRSISLPSLSCGTSQFCTRFAGAYATVRRQFNLSIGRFEGVQEALARVGGYNYMLNAARRLTAGAVDQGEKPSVLSAVMKAYCTEGMRRVVNDAMDVVGGAGISRGPRNLLARAYQAVPIGITVEGANILTRTMIIFGQGAIRCHPFVQDEMRAVEDGDTVRFDRAFFGHVNFVVCNLARAFFRGVFTPPALRASGSWRVRRHLGRIGYLTSVFAALADVAMGTLGANLKRRELLTGRFADALAWLYLASASVKRFTDDGEPARDRPYLRWSVDHALSEAARALVGVLDNLPARPAAWLLKPLLFPRGQRFRGPPDTVSTHVARGIIEDGEARRSHTPDVYTPPAEEPGLGAVEAALQRVIDAAPVDRKIREALKEGRLARPRENGVVLRAVELGILAPEEGDRLQAAELARVAAIQVDSYDPETYRTLRG